MTMTKHILILLSTVILFSCGAEQKKNNEASENQEVTNTPELNLAFSDQFIDGQPVKYYLKMEQMPDMVSAYYHGELEIGQNNTTDSLMEILVSPDKNLNPFYYKCFMNICEKADSTLSTYLGEKCIMLLENNTYYCINKLKKGFPDYFTGLVANQIYQGDNWEEEINNLSLRLHLNLENEAPELRKELDLFIVGVKNDIEHMM